MDTIRACILGQLHKNDPMKVFDWCKAAKLIKELNPTEVFAGLQDDWGYTSGIIYKDNNPVNRDDTYTYLASNWAIPEICINGEYIECWIYQEDTPNWDASTYWPKEALKILNEETKNE